MAMYNLLNVQMRCPHCGNVSEMQAEFRFGFLNLDTYSLGDKLRWTDEHGNGLRFPNERPTGGNYIGEAYVECPVCHKDLWLTVWVVNDIIERAEYDPTKKGYIP
jgi:hypothetical protein